MDFSLLKRYRVAARRALFVVVALAMYWSAERPAAAVTTISPPWDASVRAIIGTKTTALSGGRYVVNAVLIWRRASTGACVTTVLGNAFGLSTDYSIVGSSADDSMLVVDAGHSAALCGTLLTGLNYNGHYLDLSGRSGSDELEGSSGDTHVWGDSGNDVVITHGNNPIYGGSGDDLLFGANPSATNEWLSGGDGDDCIFDASGTAATYTCGPGTDDRAGTAYLSPGDEWSFYPEPVRTTSCESIGTDSNPVVCDGAFWAGAGS